MSEVTKLMLSRYTCDSCGQDLRGTDFDGHYNIYCHKPGCAEHLTPAELQWGGKFMTQDGTLHDSAQEAMKYNKKLQTMTTMEQRARELRERIISYVASGGLFNPEMALHDNVRDLLRDCCDVLGQVTSVQAEARQEEAKVIADHMDRYLNRDATTMEVFMFVEERMQLKPPVCKKCGGTGRINVGKVAFKWCSDCRDYRGYPIAALEAQAVDPGAGGS